MTTAATTRDLADRDRLRELLWELSTNPARSWSSDPDAAALMEFCAGKYAALARSYGQSPHDAVVAAFFELRRPRLLEKDDPWGFVTTSVEAALKAAQRGDELLVGERAARHRQPADVHEARRLDAESWAVLADVLPTEHTPAPETGCATRAGQVAPGEVDDAVRAAVWVLAATGWDPRTAAVAMDYITDRLTSAGSLDRAHAYLRKDAHALVLLDISQHQWLALLAAVLGTPAPGLNVAATGQGLLMRLILGQPAWDLLRDERLAALLMASDPGRPATTSGVVADE
ncbi:hypothetical protein [Xylanimonas protaetiae]|uniref:Serine/arginine repetitive matrix protein 2 n=1 Tax=Xylanimonas protaetiae TaxID=2509457 RepID=A0A4P6F247_9MICO|nr:hypothetical protein [Xylanimonas protaetiae]QAY68773.1 hypothetical protein ET471_00850 [Xylanimonas protaetiae]